MPREKPRFDDEVADLLTWSTDAACKRYDPTMWDTRRNRQQVTVLTKANEQAVDICLDCPVMMQCLAHAFLYDKSDGIYGSMTDEERVAWAEKATAA